MEPDNLQFHARGLPDRHIFDEFQTTMLQAACEPDTEVYIVHVQCYSYLFIPIHTAHCLRHSKIQNKYLDNEVMGC